MSTSGFTTITSRTVVMPQPNIDTDQIIPARFLKVTSRQGLGKSLFADWRYHSDGSLKADFILNQPATQGAQVLVAGDNFGCGSSREHAPWALVDYGFRVVVSSSIANIFRGNAVKNGLVPVQVGAETHRKLLETPGTQVTLDLDSLTLQLSDGSRVPFPLDPFARYCLMNGLDELSFLLQQEEAIGRFESKGEASHQE